MQALLEGWSDVRVERLHWRVEVEPGAWVDAVAAATPRTGSVLAQVSDAQRAQARATYIDAANSRFGIAGGRVVLPATAVLVSGVRR